MGKYMISVVTPYHNVNEKMFDGCVNSMLRQSIGFENIEWVITLHNCREEHIERVREKLGSYENVILDVLNNDCHTAASPRNNGLGLATSDYVAFLDGDDKFRPDALERLVGYFGETGAQVLVFRREYELEFPDMLAISETVPWDTTREIIMVDSKLGMENRIYNDFPFFITSRAFDLNFLRANNISFDENIVVGEDIYFNLQTIHLAERICFLPQFIGYIYYINSASAIGGEKTDEEILRIVSGLQIVIERALDYGLFVDNIIIANAFVLSRYLGSPKVKMETRIKVRDIYEPYLKMTSPIPEGRFIEPFRTMMNVLPSEILLNIRRFEQFDGNVPMNGFDVLKGILVKNKDTHYGRRYHFEDILTPRGYQSQLPLTSFASYQPMIDIEKSIGDISIYAAEKPSWYIRLMNDMLVPVSAKQARCYADAFRRQLRGSTVLIWSEDDDPIIASNNGVYTSSVSGITLEEYRWKYRYDPTEGARRYVLPYEISFDIEGENGRTSQSLADRNYLKLLLCAANRSIDQIVLFGSFDLGSLRSGLADCLSGIADDIENGRIAGQRSYTATLSRIIDMYLRPDPERAAELRALAKLGDALTLRDVWKDLSEITVICVHPTPDSVSEFDGIPLRRCLIASEFGIIGTASGEEGEYILERDAIFYEFIPAGAPDGERPLLADALRPGDKVRPVITTDAGLYRLPLKFMMEISGIENGNILFRPCR